MDDAQVPDATCMNITVTGEDGVDTLSRSGRADQGICRRTRLRAECAIRTVGAVAIHGDRAAVKGSSGYAHADRLPVLAKPYGGPGFQPSSAILGLPLGCAVVGRSKYIVVIADGRAPPTQAEMGSCDLRA